MYIPLKPASIRRKCELSVLDINCKFTNSTSTALSQTCNRSWTQGVLSKITSSLTHWHRSNSFIAYSTSWSLEICLNYYSFKNILWSNFIFCSHLQRDKKKNKKIAMHICRVSLLLLFFKFTDMESRNCSGIGQFSLWICSSCWPRCSQSS